MADREAVRRTSLARVRHLPGSRNHIITDIILANRFQRPNDVFETGAGAVKFQRKGAEDWSVPIIRSVTKAKAGCRIKRLVRRWFNAELSFVTYGGSL
ncbi:hypothetical protein ACRBEV_22730 [Methylobacterium phyllosphaerae]